MATAGPGKDAQANFTQEQEGTSFTIRCNHCKTIVGQWRDQKPTAVGIHAVTESHVCPVTTEAGAGPEFRTGRITED